MSDGTKWWDVSWNPMTGCTPVSEACEHCWAERMAGRNLPVTRCPCQYGSGRGSFGCSTCHGEGNVGFAPTFHPDRLEKPLRWHKPRRIFVNSMSDIFHEAFSDEQIARVFGIMALGSPSALLQDGRWWPTSEPHHTHVVLTKRQERMRSLLSDPEFPNLIGSVASIVPIWPMPHVWLGVTVEDYHHLDRVNCLRDTPAAVRWISAEPLLGWLSKPECDGRKFDPTGIDWVVLGGESGPGARPMQPEWALDVYHLCKAAGVAFYFKQWGTAKTDRRQSLYGPDIMDMEATHELPEAGS